MIKVNNYMSIYLDVKESREYLLKNGLVYNLRNEPIDYNRIGIRVSKDFNKFEIIGLVKVTFVKEIINNYDLKEYVMQSGFYNVDDWLKEAKGSKYLHKVELIH